MLEEIIAGTIGLLLVVYITYSLKKSKIPTILKIFEIFSVWLFSTALILYGFGYMPKITAKLVVLSSGLMTIAFLVHMIVMGRKVKT